MTPKQYLSQIYWLDRQIDALIESIEVHRARLLASGFAFTNDRVDGGSRFDLSRIVDEIVDLERQVNNYVLELGRKKRKAIKQIAKVDSSLYRNILIRRYINFNDLYKIAKDLGYSYSHLRRLHGYALHEFGEKNLEKLKDDTK